jgi:hypothetical protein
VTTFGQLGRDDEADRATTDNEDIRFDLRLAIRYEVPNHEGLPEVVRTVRCGRSA